MPTGILDIIQQTEYMSFLNEAPDITFFRVIFRRYTQFSLEVLTQSGEMSGKNISTTLFKSGDLVHQIYVKVRVKYQGSVNTEEEDNTWVNTPKVSQVFSRHLPYLDFDDYFKALADLFPGVADGPLSATFTDVDALVEEFGYRLVYVAYVLLDFIDVLQDLGAQDLNGGNMDKVRVRAFMTHPLRQLVQLDGLEPKLVQPKNSIPSDLAPFLFESYSLVIGGTVVDSYDPFFYSAQSCLDRRFDCQEYSQLTRADDGGYVIIPLRFYFCKYNALALPICALRFHDVRIEITQTSLPFLQREWSIESVDFIVQYIHLSDRERLKFTTTPHEYLIHQCQSSVSDITPGKTDIFQELIFNRPSMQLMWFVVAYSSEDGRFSTLYPTTALTQAQLLLGGDSVGDMVDPEYYYLVDPYRSNTRLLPETGIHVLSFALDCHAYQPSGSLNLGRIPHVYLRASIRPDFWEEINPTRLSLHVYSHCYNILRISNGFSDVAFS